MSIDDDNIRTQRRRGPTSAITFSMRQIGYREWTAVEKHKLKGLAERGLSVQKIARSLKRSVCITQAMASKLGIRFGDKLELRSS
ncbi:hypothetical protein [Tardiphaga robiniae]|uniref:Helix-turn-helix domain-containing protein n=1 Tax=Tardiphaga robiniae TaxID=943830 RepID=A0A7G6TXH2_9BRAD|nr:hypothetical protein [Tardiphaga robiniae]QND71454.1 hypothetical protein HB776_09550 [Tardiphaga robiniae]